MFSKEISSVLGFFSIYDTEQKCVDFFEKMRWNGNVISPFDESSIVWKCKNNKYRCKNSRKYFNVKTGSLMDSSNLSCRTWLFAIWMMTSHKKGISSIQLAKDLNVTQATAWFIAKRIRACFGKHVEVEPMDGIIEVDETFVGGKNKNRHKDKKVAQSQGRSYKDKTPVLGILQRTGKLRAVVIPNTSAKSILPHIKQHVKKFATVISDEWWAYTSLSNYYDHHIVNHAKKEYVNHDNSEIHTNSIEGFWGIFKRGIIGIYNSVSRKRLQLYVDEFVFRYNTRKIKDFERFCLFLTNIQHRLKYKDLISLS